MGGAVGAESPPAGGRGTVNDGTQPADPALSGPNAAAAEAPGLWALQARTRPPRPVRGVMPRPRLQAWVPQLQLHRLTWIKAPPGYGKTCVALAWADAARADGAAVAWLTLGPEDNDVQRLLAGLQMALHQALAPPASPSPGWVPVDVSLPVDERLAWLHEAVAREGRPVLLFIDDLHELHEPEALRVLQQVVRWAPPPLHLVLLGRAAPKLPLADLRAQSALLELGPEELAFDLAETTALLHRQRPEDDDAAEPARLQALTDGWIAALRAALLGPRGHRQPAGRRPLRPIEALFDELLAGLPAPTRRFVEVCCVPARVCPALAQALLSECPDQGDAAARLQALEEAQLFLSAPDEGGWRSFHPLLREHVRRRTAEADPARGTAWQRAAAQWHARAGLWSDAIGHALAAGDHGQALAWIDAHAMSVVGAGDLLTLRDWERQLRTRVVGCPPRLRLAFAWGLGLAMDCDRALALLDSVEAELASAADEAGGLQPDRPPSARLDNECRALRAALVSTTGDHELADTLAHACLLDQATPPWVRQAVINVQAAAQMHRGQWQGLHRTTLEPGAEPGDPMSLDYRLSIRGLAEFRQGHLDEAARLLTEAMAIGQTARPGPAGQVLAALPAPTLALLRYAQDRLDEARRLNDAYFEVNRRVAPIEGLTASYLVAARLACLDGRPEQARHRLEEGERIAAARGWPGALAVLRLERLRLALRDGRGAEAAALAASLHDRAEGRGPHGGARQDAGRAGALAQAWMALSQGDPVSAEAAQETLAAAWQAAERSGRRLDQIATGGALALAQSRAGQAQTAQQTLDAVIGLVRRTGAVRLLLDQPQDLAPLLQAAFDRAGAPAGDPLWAALRAPGPKAATGHAAPHEGLTPRERLVLSLLSQGRSNKEIARDLGIAPETVKTHVSRLLGKLGATNRAEAVARAGVIAARAETGS